jgi:hypothetical protein
LLSTTAFIFAATLNIGGRSSISNLRKRHAVVVGTHLSQLYRVKEKCTAKPTEGEPIPQHKKNILEKKAFCSMFSQLGLLTITKNFEVFTLSVKAGFCISEQ